jgi:Flp pilus assembly protein TadD
MAYRAKGFTDKALEQLEEAARLNPADELIRNELARVRSPMNSAPGPGR